MQCVLHTKPPLLLSQSRQLTDAGRERRSNQCKDLYNRFAAKAVIRDKKGGKDKKNGTPSAASEINSDYDLRRRATPIPAIAKPTNASVAGSGTVRP
jgi:hypothetical protein